MQHVILLPLIGWLLSGCGVPQTPEAFNATPEAQFLRTVVGHEGINDAFVGKASVVWYWRQGKWLKLQGAD